MLNNKKVIRYAVVDDEVGAIEDLRWELKNLDHPLLEVGAYTDPAEAIHRLEKKEPDLLFLDVSMPRIDGFGLVESLKEINFDIVFTTAYDQYAIEAFRHNAIDYLLKPVSGAELMRVLEKHLSNRMTKNMKEQLESLKQVYENTGERLKIYVKDEYRYLPFRDIIRLEAKSNYTAICTQEQEYLVSYPLKDYEQQLPEELFLKIHRSHIVNKTFIQSVGSSLSKYVVMNNGDKLPVSRSKFMELKGYIH